MPDKLIIEKHIFNLLEKNNIAPEEIQKYNLQLIQSRTKIIKDLITPGFILVSVVLGTYFLFI